MHDVPLYPLRFDAIFEYRLWGGRRLGNFMTAPLPGAGPIGEAWILSDREEHPSVVADGPLKGATIRQLLRHFGERLLGTGFGRYRRFPLLLKFLDVTKRLSVQVHPSDADRDLIPPGDSGKDEAWVVLSDGPQARIYAGLTAGSNEQTLRQAVGDGTVAGQLASFAPQPGDAVFIPAGTVHSLSDVPAGTVHSLSDVMVFEVQENSDVTFRLFDWNHIDPRTGQARPLQVEQAMACIDFHHADIHPLPPATDATDPVLHEQLIHSHHFDVQRHTAQVPFTVGATGKPRVLVCAAGHGPLRHGGVDYPFSTGDLLLLPAEVGACSCQPFGITSVLEISLPEAA